MNETDIALLLERYENDPAFKAAVDSIPSGWTDDDGCYWDGPSLSRLGVGCILCDWQDFSEDADRNYIDHEWRCHPNVHTVSKVVERGE